MSMTEEKRQEKLEYLRKQRDGIVQGGYRDLLVATHKCLSDFCKNNPEGWCNPYNNQICKVVYGNTYHVPMITGFVSDLRSLGYIRIVGSGKERKIFIEKEVDF